MTLLDPDLRSVLIVVDRVSKIAYFALFGDEFDLEASTHRPARRINLPKQDDYKDPSVFGGTRADTMSYRSGMPAMPYQRTIRGNEIAPYQSIGQSRKSKPSDFGNIVDSIQYMNKPEQKDSLINNLYGQGDEQDHKSAYSSVGGFGGNPFKPDYEGISHASRKKSLRSSLPVLPSQ